MIIIILIFLIFFNLIFKIFFLLKLRHVVEEISSTIFHRLFLSCKITFWLTFCGAFILDPLEVKKLAMIDRFTAGNATQENAARGYLFM